MKYSPPEGVNVVTKLKKLTLKVVEILDDKMPDVEAYVRLDPEVVIFGEDTSKSAYMQLWKIPSSIYHDPEDDLMHHEIYISDTAQFVAERSLFHGESWCEDEPFGSRLTVLDPGVMLRHHLMKQLTAFHKSLTVSKHHNV